MPEDVYLNRSEGYIYIRSYGIVTLEELQRALEQVLVYQRESQVQVLLIDTREQERVPDVKEHYQFLQSVPSDLHIAILTNRKTETHGNQMFFAEAGRYKGKSVQLFSEERDAKKWIADRTGACIKFKVQRAG